VGIDLEVRVALGLGKGGGRGEPRHDLLFQHGLAGSALHFHTFPYFRYAKYALLQLHGLHKDPTFLFLDWLSLY